MEDIEIIAMGFKVIFPCLFYIGGHDGCWEEVESKLKGRRFC